MSAAKIEISPVSEVCSRSIVDDRSLSRLTAWHEMPLTLPDDGTHFGFVSAGRASLEWQSEKYPLRAGMYFSLPGGAKISGLGSGFVATRLEWQGFFQLGGPAEEQGRLRYIDGCSDSLLIPPVQAGDPCLNLLYLPPGTMQTQHTHPSSRMGMIISGRGTCKTPDAQIPLHAGLVFSIAPDVLHSFQTRDEALRVAAWHPDSDFGPTDHNHPMVNRTMIEGVSAAQQRMFRTE